MLIATAQTGFGDIPGVTGVGTLQTVLRRLALKYKDHSLDPAQYDGTMTIGTIVALANAAPKIGNHIDPVIGHAVDVIGVFKKPFSYVPYGDTVINVILSPWLVDKFYGALLGIIRVIPGGDGVADSINGAIKAVKEALATVAAPVAAGIGIVLGTNLGDCSWDDPTGCVTDAADAVSSAASTAAGWVVDAANAVADAASAVGSALAKVASKVWQDAVDATKVVWNAIEKYGCALVNNDIVVAATTIGAGIVASPATAAAVAAAEMEAKGACAVMAVVDLAYAIYQFLANKFDPPPSLDTVASGRLAMIAALRPALFMAMDPTTSAPQATSPPPPPPQVSVVLPPPSIPPSLQQPTYPPGSVAAFDPTLNKYRLAIPVGTTLTGLGAATHMEVPPSDVVPSGVTVVSLTAFQRDTGTLPLVKNPWFWVAIGVSVAAVGGSVVFAVRRRRKKKLAASPSPA